jgi:hypothetical protein
MTLNSTKASALSRPRSLLLKGIKAGLIAGPILFAAAPSHAATTVTKTFTGFTEAFAPSNWALTQTGSGAAATVTGTNITLSRPVSAGTTAAVFTASTAILDAFKPTNAITFLYGSPSFTWEWQTSAGMNNTALNRYQFSPQVGGIVSSVKWNPQISAVANQVYTGTVNPLTVIAPGGTFGFSHIKTPGGSAATTTGTVTAFTFEAVYSAVPGPLPLAAAAAGFAWSRKLRRRLKTAQFAA